MADVTKGGIACLAEGRVEVSVPPKTLNALLGTLDRFESDKRAYGLRKSDRLIIRTAQSRNR